MNGKPAPARCAAVLGAAAAATLALAAGSDPAGAQYYGRDSQYGRPYPYPYPYSYPYERGQRYGRDRDRELQPRRERREAVQPRTAGTPLLAVVSLNEQRITVYDSAGRHMLQSPVSTGAKGYETPVGIYSVVQKKEEHHSNVYEDGNMPFMQRITWTGIALHAGVLPGHPASHGCVRMPLDFAERLFALTDIGLRVIVVREDIHPAEIAHPVLFQPSPAFKEAMLAAPTASSALRVSAPASERTPQAAGSSRLLAQLQARAAAKSAEAQAAGKKATAARQAATRRAAEAAPAARALRAAEDSVARAEDGLRKAEQAVTAAEPPSGDLETDAAREKAEAKLAAARTARDRAAAKLAEAQAQLASAKAQARAKAEAAEQAEKEAKAAEFERDQAAEAAEQASLLTSPVSVFISRKTQRLYIRKGYHPLFEGPVTIRDPGKAIGSYVFTALEQAGEGSQVRWSVVSMYKAGGAGEAPPEGERRRGDKRSKEAAPADVAGARAALDRIEIPAEVRERISQVVLPGSSLIVSDEGASLETGKDTDFVVLMSGEPQGGIKTRRREPPGFRNDYYFGSRGGGLFPFSW